MNLIDIIKSIDIENIIFDFDNTITTYDSSTSIGVFTKYCGDDYKEKKNNIDYMVKNCSNNLELKKLWYSKMKLLEEYYNYNLIDKVKNEFKIRKSFFEVYKYCKKNNINIIICSSGFKPLIKFILENNNIFEYTLYANDFNTKYNNIIHTNNKKKFLKNISKNIIVGDQLSDLSMSNKNTVLKIGIDIDEANKSYFDYVITE